MLQKLQLRPGINRESTNYANEGGWYDGDKVRFRAGMPEKIGGWKKSLTSTFQGSCRSLHEWMALDSNRFLSLGTHLKFYILWGDAFYNITPIRSVAVIGTNPFTTGTIGTDSLIVTHTAHGATLGDFVTFSGATLGFDAYSLATLNTEYQIVEILNANSYRLETDVVNLATGITGGGGPVTATYEIFAGLDVAVPGTGWGAGPWGTPGGWGDPYSVEDEGSVPFNQIRLWTQDNFGEDLIFAIRGGQIYYWDRTTGVDERGIPLGDMVGANEAPTYAFTILISEGDRHVVAVGTNDIGEDFLDPLLVRWSDQENALDWEPRRDNSAGSYRLSSGSSMAGALRTRQETLIWTEKNLHSMRFVGAPYTFGFNLIAENVSLLSPSAAVNAGGRVWWMDRNSFYTYSGQVQELPCTVRDYVFGDFNMDQRAKVIAGHNHNFQEVVWFYPTASSAEVDRYVAYQYVDNLWNYGSLERTAWLDLVWGGSYPVATADGYLYNHEFGDDADSEPMAAWVESSDIDIEDGERFAFLRRVIPDVVFRGGGDAQVLGLTLRLRRAPGDFYIDKDRVEITPFTKDCWIRARARQFAVRLESEALGTGWRLGAFRVDMQPDGRR